jgi:hypothetical protein
LLLFSSLERWVKNAVQLTSGNVERLLLWKMAARFLGRTRGRKAAVKGGEGKKTEAKHVKTR